MLDVASFVRAQEMRALLEACAIAKMISALEELAADEEARSGVDAIAEHTVASLQRRIAKLREEHEAVLGRSDAAAY